MTDPQKWLIDIDSTAADALPCAQFWLIHLTSASRREQVSHTTLDTFNVGISTSVNIYP